MDSAETARATRSRRGEKAAVGALGPPTARKRGVARRGGGEDARGRVRPAEDGADVVDTAAGRDATSWWREATSTRRGSTRALCGARRPFPERGLTFRPGGGSARRKASTRGRGVRRGSGERHARRETAGTGRAFVAFASRCAHRGGAETHAIQQQQQPPGASGRVDTMRSASRWSTVQ